jgi:hypothetical protein
MRRSRFFSILAYISTGLMLAGGFAGVLPMNVAAGVGIAMQVVGAINQMLPEER